MQMDGVVLQHQLKNENSFAKNRGTKYMLIKNVCKKYFGKSF